MIEALRVRVAEVRAQLARVARELDEDARSEPREAVPPPAAAPARPSAEHDKAAMVALNMAVNGAPPTETARYLAEHFELPDATRIVADAYAQSAWIRGRPPAATPSR